MKISEAFSMYQLDYIAFKGQSKKTQDGYIATCKHLLNRFSDVDISTLTFTDIRDWKLWLDSGRSPNTVRGYLMCLRSVLRFVRRRGVDCIDYQDIPIPHRLETDVKFLDEDEIEFIIDFVSEHKHGYSNHNRLRNRAILCTFAATGLRNAELCSLSRGSIKNNTFTVIGKGSKLRIGFIHDRAIEAIDDYLSIRKDDNRALFLTNSGKRITTSDVRRIFDMIRHNTGLDYIHPHTMRHSYATELLIHRVDIRHVQLLMGHSDLNTTARYTHVVNEDLKEIYLRSLT